LTHLVHEAPCDPQRLVAHGVVRQSTPTSRVRPRTMLTPAWSLLLTDWRSLPRRKITERFIRVSFRMSSHAQDREHTRAHDRIHKRQTAGGPVPRLRWPGLRHVMR
jgi:hypothetical protein